jgi:hypothetical protein
MMSHLAMLEGVEDGDGTTWLEPVTDEQYQAACGFRRNGALSPEVLEHLFRWYGCSAGTWGRSVSDG